MQVADTAEIQFGVGGNAQPLQKSGWSNPEESFTWSIGSYAELLLPRSRTGRDVFIFITLCPFLHPPKLMSQRLIIEIDGILVFSGRCWGHHRLALRFSFDNNPKEFSILRASFPDAVKPSEFKIRDHRTLAFQWRNVKICPQNDESVVGSNDRVIDSEKTHTLLRENMLEKWVEEELRPWYVHRPRRLDCEFLFAHLNATTHWAAIYRFYDGHVEFIPKPANVELDSVIFDRAQCYLRFFRALVSRLPTHFDATICVCVADYPMRVEEVPIFAFQRSEGTEIILLPDIDFLLHDFYSHSRYRDNESYLTKEVRAVFAGSTTGGDIDGETARSASLPRLRAATYFAKNERVHFYLPAIVQCTTKEAEEILRSKTFCQQPALTWHEQCRYRFQISIDGNGAACSRLALCLSSNSALLKYASSERLYYFHGLIPGVHFVPIKCDSDIEDVIAEEIASPGRFQTVASKGSEFAKLFLSRDKIEEYTAILLDRYAKLFIA